MTRPNEAQIPRDVQAGMAWWNDLTEFERSFWLKQSGGATVEGAWAYFTNSRDKQVLAEQDASEARVVAEHTPFNVALTVSPIRCSIVSTPSNRDAAT